MKKKWLFMVIGLLLIVGMIGVGGKVYMDKKEERKEAEKIEAERMSVKALKNTFEGIKVVEFVKSDYNMMTGDYLMIVKMTNINEKEVEFDYLYSNSDEKITSYGVIDEHGVQLEGKTSKNVKIIYSNGKEDEG